MLVARGRRGELRLQRIGDDHARIAVGDMVVIQGQRLPALRQRRLDLARIPTIDLAQSEMCVSQRQGVLGHEALPQVDSRAKMWSRLLVQRQPVVRLSDCFVQDDPGLWLIGKSGINVAGGPIQHLMHRHCGAPPGIWIDGR